jgi:ribonuclease HI
MVPEFKSIHQHPADHALPEFARTLNTPARGIAASGEVEGKGTLGKTITIGIHHKPNEFVQKALQVGHPTRLHSFFPDEICEVTDHCLRRPAGVVAQERTEEIRRWIHLTEEMALEEEVLKENMTERRRTVLKNKNLTLFKRLMIDAGHQDRGLVDQLAEGFDLTGALPESSVFSRKVRPASISCEDLRRVADICRDGMLQSVVASGDDELDRQLYEATSEEVGKGFLVGPVDIGSLPPGATLTRRFGVKQKSKTRPIDDYKASFVNASVSQSETATVHTVDHVASLIACFLRKAAELSSKRDLSAKTWDLADAYKQIPLSDHAFSNDAFLAVYNPKTCKAEVFQQKVLPFGSVASVTAFLRVAHGLWKIGNKLLRLMWTSYFDDFFSVTETVTTKHTDLVIASMFSILGWKLSSDKLISYDTTCKVLGVKFDLRMSGDGLSFVTNTEDRAMELCETLDAVIQTRQLRKTDGEKLRGRLQFASGQLFGRGLRNHLRVLSKHIQSSRQTLCENTLASLGCIRAQLLANNPRSISGPMSDHIHVYVDASFDPDGYSGVGGIAYNSDGSTLAFFSEEIDRHFIQEVMEADQKTIIQELEMLALLIAAELWCPIANGRRIVAFSDSESVRGSFLKTWSANDPCSDVLQKIFSVEESFGSIIWLERVPGQSNPADHFSRCQVALWSGLHKTP